ncbi:uncharacterized protein ACBT44_012089 [Syngnathus typhle]
MTVDFRRDPSPLPSNTILSNAIPSTDTIAPDILQQKLIQLAVPASTCQWITSFLTNRRQRVTPVKLLKYADDTTPIGLIQDGDETAYRQEVERLVHWCSPNHLELNPLKTVEMTVDFRHLQVPGIHNLSGPEMDRPHRLCPEVGRAEYFLRQLRKFNLPQELLKTYTAIIQSILCTSITVWFGSATKQDKHRLQARTLKR